MSKFNVVDLFCGAGGLSAGLIDSGMDVVAAFDNSADSLKIYERNISSHAFNADLNNVKDISAIIADYSPDMIAGGPPCQDFSTAGKREEGNRANLTVAFGKIVASNMPKFFIMENVPQVRNSLAYQSLKNILNKKGYSISEHLIDASKYGVPQIRKRYFVFGWKSKVNYGSKLETWLAEKQNCARLTIKQYLKSEIEIDYYYRHPRNYSRRSVFSVHEPSPTIRGVNRPVPPNYTGNHLDSAPPSTVRPLTTWERSRIQTFPVSWNWNCNDRNSVIETNIGNAVPVNLGSMLGNGILNAIC